VDEELLEKAPGFDKDDGPDMTNREWRSRISGFFDVKP